MEVFKKRTFFRFRIDDVENIHEHLLKICLGKTLQMFFDQLVLNPANLHCVR